MPFRSSGRGAYGPQGQRVLRGPLAPVWVTSGTLAQATPGTAYSVQLSATDDSGVAPTYTLVSGSLPSGLSVSSSGLISGTPSNSGTFTFTVRATDENGRFTDSSTLTIVSVVPETTTPGGRVWNSAGTYSFTVPAGVLRMAAVVIGGGGGGGRDGSYNHGGGGGGLARSEWAVTPGQVYTVVVGGGGSHGGSVGGNGGQSSISLGGTTYLFANGGGGGGNPQNCGGSGGCGGVNVGTGGSYCGGFGAAGDYGDDPGGGGGAAGYVSNGGNAEAGTTVGQVQCYVTDSGRSGNGGASGDGTRGGYGDQQYGTDQWPAGGGGGTGLYGGGGQVGGGDQGGQPGCCGANSGGNFGGGGGGVFTGKSAGTNGVGATGAVRIIWGKVGGNYRSFPNGNVADSPSYGGTSEPVNTNG